VRCETPFDDSTDPDFDIQLPAAPSKLQTHGTMAAVVVLGVALMAVIFGLSVRDVGPFTGTITGQQLTGDTVTVTVQVANEGDRGGRGNCRIRARKTNGVVANVAPFVTESIPGGGSVTRTVDVPVSEGAPAEVSCN
jgi:hypothetical protein